MTMLKAQYDHRGPVPQAVIRAVPLYMNYSKVAQAFEQTRTEFASTESVNGQMLKSSLDGA